MSNKFEPLHPNEVISLNVYGDYYSDILYEEGMFNMAPTFRRSELEESIKEVLIGFHDSYEGTRRKLLGKGLACEALKFGSKDWQKGKVRVRIEIDFYPDEAEPLNGELKSEIHQNPNGHSLDSSLDDIRSIINEG